MHPFDSSLSRFSNTKHAKRESFAINQARLSRREGNSQEEGGRKAANSLPLAIELLISRRFSVHVSMFVATLTRRAYLPCRSPVICSPSWPDGEALAAAATTPSPLQRNYVMLAKLFE